MSSGGRMEPVEPVEKNESERAAAHSPLRALVGVALLLGLAFVASTLFIERHLGSIDDGVTAIVGNTSPSVRELSAARTEMRNLELLTGVHIGAHAQNLDFDQGRMDKARRLIDEHLATYLRIPFNPGEATIADELDRAKRRAYALTDRVVALTDASRLAEARELTVNALAPAFDRLDELTDRLIQINAAGAERVALDIRRVRHRSAVLALVLDAITVLLGVVLIVVVYRAARLHQRLIEEQRREAELRAEELDRFAGRVAHDLKAPLSALLMGSSAALEIPGTTRKSLERIQQSARMMASMIDALLEFARSSAQPAQDRGARVASVVEEVIAEAQPLAEEAGAVIEVEPPPPECAVKCSEGVLASVVSNLVQNAVKYVADVDGEKRVLVRVRALEDVIRFEVADTGPGLPADLEDRLFGTFVRGSNAAGKPGLGLGLATVKRLVEAHHGRLGVAPPSGRGTCFWVQLPRGGDRPPAN